MAQITYTNKVALNENPEIADINKVTDDDMNEIKSVVNNNYNKTIQITGTQPSDSDWKIWVNNSQNADNTYYNDNGTATQFKATTYDTLPVGTEVDYDGQTVPSGWTEIIGTNIITAGLNSDYTTTSTNEEKLTINKEIIKIGDELSLSNGSIVIGSGINYIKISSQVNLSNGMQSGDRIMGLIKKNDSNVVVSNMIVRGLYETIYFSPKLISVSEGDTISVYIRTLTRSGATIPSDSNFTYITVETVKEV